MKARLAAGELEDREVEVTHPRPGDGPGLDPGRGQHGADGDGPPGHVREDHAQADPDPADDRRARPGPILLQQEIEALIDPEKINQAAVTLAEESGIVFIDEIDKIAGDEGSARGPGRLAPGRPARPAADRRGDDRQHQVRPGEDRPRPVRRRRRVPSLASRPT